MKILDFSGSHHPTEEAGGENRKPQDGGWILNSGPDERQFHLSQKCVFTTALATG